MPTHSLRRWTATSAFLRLQSRTMNRETRPLARAGIGPWSLVRHVGRRSGRTYETPLLIARVPDGFIIELTYGPEVDWYRNIVAAGCCVIVYRGIEYPIDRIEPRSAVDGRAAYPGRLPRLVLRLLGSDEFRFLHIAPRSVGQGNPTSR
ncbi:MAG: nitroreductase family deazaflavin-dependent oxidoreductase [Pseudonocardia sp.]|uniref:nitroreductase family deazaflavin-dependent oxidoreductase n=1 Tax=Pseudonocardia sp. TaxID=60912 RepID=UPI001AC7C1C7|nr:nitroreductase family deazaflavin-dependent oxidoreductase [Pseudonocardia sp.]MBN9099326.1 nitroreductase family deazaflavin-dependent oxidoreductase [Pseudonocardia sp.]